MCVIVYLIASIFYFFICDYFVDTFFLQRFFYFCSDLFSCRFRYFHFFRDFRYICEVHLTLLSAAIRCFRILAIGYISGHISP